MFIQRLSQFHSSRDHTRPPRLSFALGMILTMNARRFPAKWDLLSTRQLKIVWELLISDQNQ